MKRSLETKKAYFILVLFGLLANGCTTFGTTSKAPITPILSGGSEKERMQELELKRIKSLHADQSGRALGDTYFMNTKKPISGARKRDTLVISEGPYKGSYGIKKVIRVRSGKKRRVILELNKKMPIVWKEKFSGSNGIHFKNNILTDDTLFPPIVPMGAKLVVGTVNPQIYIVQGSTLVELPNKPQRVGYVLDRPIPPTQNASYKLYVPDPSVSQKLSFKILWRGGMLSGYNFSIGINRRRYENKEILDLLKSNPDAKKELNAIAAKNGSATVLRIVGILAVGVGGFLGLVRRDDFQGSAQAIPWAVVGGGVALIGISVPISVSRNNDFLRASKAYNKSILNKLQLPQTLLGDVAGKGNLSSPPKNKEKMTLVQE